VIAETLLDQIRDATDIVELISQKVVLKRSGGNYKGLCPFHNEKTPSFTVHSGKQIYRCFGCGAGGDAFSFLMRSQGLNFAEAARVLAGRCGITIPEDGEDAEEAKARQRQRDALLKVLDLAAVWFRRQLQDAPEAQEARIYAGKRGLDQTTQERFRLGYAPMDPALLGRAAQAKGFDEALLLEAGLLSKGEDGRVYARFRGRLIFPIENSAGKVVGFGGRLLAEAKGPKYLNSPETPVFHKSDLLYALPQAREAVMARGQAVLVEGYMDALACHQAGFPFAVASLGTAFGETHAKALKRYAREALLVFDTDTAGLAAARRAAEPLLEAGLSVRVLALEGAKDPDEFIRHRGREAFDQALSKAQSAVPHFVALGLKALGSEPEARSRAEVLQGIFPLLKLHSTAVETDSHLRAAAKTLGFPEDAALADYQAYLAGKGSRRQASASPKPEEPRINDDPPAMGQAPTSRALPAPQKGKPGLKPKPDALSACEREILRLLIEQPDLVATAMAELALPEFSQADANEAAGLLWKHPGMAVLNLPLEESASEGARNLLLDLSLEPPRHARPEEALPRLMARLHLERLKVEKGHLDEALRQASEDQAPQILARIQAANLRMQQYKRQANERG
jgi:DNA primase